MPLTSNESPRTRIRRRMLIPQAAPDFLDASLEWRRLFAEFWGTFLLVLVLVAAGGGVVRSLSGGSISLAMIVVGW